MRRVIITGGSGLIGRALSEQLKSYAVFWVSRSVGVVSDGFTVISWDELPSRVEGAYAVVNLAGATIGRRWSKRYKEVLRASRLEAGRKVTEAVLAAKRRPKVLIQASAVGAYGDCGDSIVTEETSFGDDFAARLCRDWEESTRMVEDVGVRRVIIRTGQVIAKEGGMLPKLLPLFRMGLGGPVCSGKQYWPWISLQDEARAIRFLMEKDEARGAFNLAAGSVTSQGLAAALGKVLHRPAFFRVPKWLLRTAVLGLADAMGASQRIEKSGLERLGFRFEDKELGRLLAKLLSS